MIINYNEILNINLWWKIENLLKIKDKFNFPKWFIVTEEKEVNKNIFEYYKNNIWTDFYICRSSMNNEDSYKLSYAWLFESIEWRYSEWLLLNDIKEVFDSLNNDFLDEYEESILWKKVKNRKMNVLVQEFIVWEVSWVYFSNYDWNRLIEYIKWCNQFMTDWIVKSNKVILDKDYNILEHTKSTQYKYIWENLDIFIFDKENNSLDEKMLNKLVSELERLKDFFDFEIDVEWTISNWNIYILQVRPITIK
jgi:phosphoenolpyruvate synthase/pyruvate phosphate dikinase